MRNCFSTQQTFFFNTNLFSICSEIIFISVFLELPTTLSRRLYIINTLQNAVGRGLQRFYVNSLQLVNKDEQKHLQ